MKISKLLRALLSMLLVLAMLPVIPMTVAGAEDAQSEISVEETEPVASEGNYNSLYVKDGLYVHLDAFTTGDVNFGFGTWRSTVGDAVATVTGGNKSDSNPTGWVAREGGGIGWDQLLTAGASVSSKSNGIYLPTSYIPEADFTAEFVAVTDGATQKDEGGNLIHFRTTWDSENKVGYQWGYTVSDCYAIGIVRTTSWLTDNSNVDGTNNTNDLGHRFFFTGMNYGEHSTSFSNKSAAGVGLGEDHVALNSPVGFINTVTWTFDRADSNLSAAFRQYNGTSQTARNSFDVTVDNCKNKSDITVLPANNAGYTKTGAEDPSAVKLQFAVGMAGTIYSIRLYNRVLSYEERLQNHFADLVAYFGLKAGCFADVDAAERKAIYEKYASTDFTADASVKEAIQADIDAAIATIDVALYGYQAGVGGTSLRIWGGIDNPENYSSVGLSVHVKETGKTMEGSTNTV